MKVSFQNNLACYSDYSDCYASQSPIQSILQFKQTIFATVSAFATTANYS